MHNCTRNKQLRLALAKKAKRGELANAASHAFACAPHTDSRADLELAAVLTLKLDSS